MGQNYAFLRQNLRGNSVQLKGKNLQLPVMVLLLAYIFNSVEKRIITLCKVKLTKFEHSEKVNKSKKVLSVNEIMGSFF